MMKRFKYFPVFFLVLLSNFITGCNGTIASEAYKDAVVSGNIIVNTLKEYKEMNGDYPDHLNQLIPNHLKSLPVPGIGKQSFFYLKTVNQEGDETGYFLSFIARPSGFLLLGAKSIQRFVYIPTQKYRNDDYVTTHYVHNGWAFQTERRAK